MGIQIFSRQVAEPNSNQNTQSLFKTKAAKILGSLSTMGVGIGITGGVLLAFGGAALSATAGIPLLAIGVMAAIVFGIGLAANAIKNHLNQKNTAQGNIKQDKDRDQSFDELGKEFNGEQLEKSELKRRKVQFSLEKSMVRIFGKTSQEYLEEDGFSLKY